MQRVWMSLGICAATLLLSLPAFASGFFVARFGGEHGHPTTDHLSSIYYNPAGLSLGKGTRLTIDANLAWRMFSYDRPEDAIDNIFDDGASGTPREAVSANAGEATLNNFIAAPFAAVASDFGIEGYSGHGNPRSVLLQADPEAYAWAHHGADCVRLADALAEEHGRDVDTVGRAARELGRSGPRGSMRRTADRLARWSGPD